MDEFSFKEMKTWGQFKISSCCLCVRCKSRKLGGNGSSRFSTPMVESFSADLLPAIKSCWAELHLELFTYLWLNLRLRRKHLTSFAFMDSYLTINHTRLACLPSRWVSPGCSMKVYWRESHMEFYQTSKTELLFESMWSAFDWANGGCVYGLFQVWWVGVGVSSDDDCGIYVWHAKVMWYIINAASILSHVIRTWPRPVINSSPAVATLQLLGLCKFSFMSLICHFVYFVMPFTPWDCLGLPFPIVFFPLPPIPILCSW